MQKTMFCLFKKTTTTTRYWHFQYVTWILEQYKQQRKKKQKQSVSVAVDLISLRVRY